MYLLGYDIGSSSVKCSLVDSQDGCVATLSLRKMKPHKCRQSGWARPDPEDWWSILKAPADTLSQVSIDVELRMTSLTSAALYALTKTRCYVRHNLV